VWDFLVLLIFNLVLLEEMGCESSVSRRGLWVGTREMIDCGMWKGYDVVLGGRVSLLVCA
jgi:hypothetical protein